MKKVKYRHPVARFVFSVSIFLSFSTLIFAQTASTDEGGTVQEETVQGPQGGAGGGDTSNVKALFNSQCAACHKLDGNSIGPPLRGISERRDTEWLHAWISNSSALIAAGDETAVEIYEEYNR